MRVTGKINTDVLTLDALATLVQESGMSCGVGEWRNEKSGIFGSFRLATDQEIAGWENFRTGAGPLPAPPSDDDDLLEAA
jgi:hypothetical protein